ncbi:hypothetical protein FA13DRAFT_1727207 [Coprinellus micaceus]|uniref:Uncharacterized protein n=1 Tax=Coprinellus micaceus TaxID=71717 RepID=A0A4Y7TSD0_COPMI|nr:hypothetical protein FA13DRAFT_1727207 [Coprinellus micaceus]
MKAGVDESTTASLSCSVLRAGLRVRVCLRPKGSHFAAFSRLRLRGLSARLEATKFRIALTQESQRQSKRRSVKERVLSHPSWTAFWA